MNRISFHGAAGTVTGSRFLLEVGRARVLVDCGSFQGIREVRERNWSPPPFEPSSIDAVVLTHAHLDHSGYLPSFAKSGFRGPIYATRGTRDLLRILLPDAGHLQEEAATHANKWGWSRHRPALPLYTEADAVACLRLVRAVDFHDDFDPAPGLTARYTRAGHILGAACLAVRSASLRVEFTGDVGRPHDPIMKAPEPLPDSDVLVVESTYGDRTHPAVDPLDELEAVVERTVAHRGVLLVPAFAVGRAQHVLYLLSELRRSGRIPEVPVFLDSPMAIDATDLLAQHLDDHRLTLAECERMRGSVRLSHTSEDSKAIDRMDGPFVVVAGSGMATGGRILHHLQRFLPHPSTTVLLVGYQAEGTLGRSLLDGAGTLRVLGKEVPVAARAVEVRTLSAHADAGEMAEWLRASRVAPRRTFVVHGEPAAAEAMRDRLRPILRGDVVIPRHGSTYDLDPLALAARQFVPGSK